jgi:hypothetical protein
MLVVDDNLAPMGASGPRPAFPNADAKAREPVFRCEVLLLTRPHLPCILSPAPGAANVLASIGGTPR